MIYYIFHSGFLIDLEHNTLIFDFYKVPNGYEKEKDELISKYIKNNKKNIYIFSSHSHLDHFNKEILTWREQNNTIKYIFSDDIVIDNDDNITFVKAGDELKIDDIQLNVFSSTDEGVSFYLNIEGKNIFHPGDLHYWNWNEDTEEDRKYMLNSYLEEINKIKKLDRIDIAFVLVDPRLEENVYDGVKIFYSELKPKVMIPIHFSYDYSAMDGFLNLFKDEDVKVVRISDSMQEILSGE